MAVVLLHNMKILNALHAGSEGKARSGALAELREMIRLYLQRKLTKARAVTSPPAR